MLNWTLATFLFWALAVYGLTFGIKDSKLLRAPRALIKRWAFFDTLLGCSFCVGFWTGLAVTAAMFPLSVGVIPLIILGGFAGASCSYVADLLVLKLEGSGD